jgi:O-antigen/teichoic acid export membrane protein
VRTAIGRLRANTAKPVRLLAGRAGWNVADQLVSSGTNVALSLLVARSLTTDGFGAFSVAFTVYSFLIAANRALIFQPLVVRYTSAAPDDYRAAAGAAAGATTVLGLLAGSATALLGLALGAILGSSLLCIGILLPGLLLQDMWRLIFMAEGRPAAAFANDSVWGVVQFAAVGAIVARHHQSAPALILGWGGAALAAALFGIHQFQARPQLGGSFRWFWRQRDLLGYYGAGFLTVMGANQITLLLIAALGAPADVGALRAAAVVLGPLNIAGYSMSAFALPEVSRRQLKGAQAIKVGIAISGVMLLADAAWGAALLGMPDGVGVKLLGDSWANAQSVLPASLFGLTAIGATLGATIVMTARGFARDTFWTTAVLAPGLLLFGLTGLQLSGAPGAAAGLALAQWLVTPLVWWRVLALLRREERYSREKTRVTPNSG